MEKYLRTVLLGTPLSCVARLWAAVAIPMAV